MLQLFFLLKAVWVFMTTKSNHSPLESSLNTKLPKEIIRRKTSWLSISWGRLKELPSDKPNKLLCKASPLGGFVQNTSFKPHRVYDQEIDVLLPNGKLEAVVPCWSSLKEHSRFYYVICQPQEIFFNNSANSASICTSNIVMQYIRSSEKESPAPSAPSLPRELRRRQAPLFLLPEQQGWDIATMIVVAQGHLLGALGFSPKRPKGFSEWTE